MENGQLAKRVEWLDGERRAAQESIAKLEKRVAELESALSEEKKTAKPLQREVTRLSVQIAKLDKFEKQLKASKKDFQSEFKRFDGERKQVRRELEAAMKSQYQSLEKKLEALDALKADLNTQQQENKLLEGKLVHLKASVDGMMAGEQERQDLAKTLREDSAKEAKRLAEMRGDLDSVLKNAEKASAKVDLVADDQRKLEKQMDSVDEAQTELRNQQREFIEQTNVRQTERERQWKEWSKRFEIIEKTSEEASTRLQELGTIDLAVKRAQKAFEELIEKINRRVNELNEIQRLGEQRLRQEWSTFQADSQKRWSNFNLGYEEQRQEANRQRERLNERLVQLEDSLQEVQDTTAHLSEQTERYFQNMLEIFRESLAENERFFGEFR